MILATSPRALILDYGGVIVSTRKRPTGLTDLAAAADERLRRAGIELPFERIVQSVTAGTAALKDYNDMSSRRREPLELTHRELWFDFMASDLPDNARIVLAGDAVRLSRAKVELLSDHTLRPGIRDLLKLCRERGIRTGISSNAQSGNAHRAFIEKEGLTDLFDVQLYSDGVGIRKPHPDMLRLVADALAVPIEKCWYVGDTRDRDLLAGRRAGVGAVVLIMHHTTNSPRYAVEGEPDGIFEEVTELVDTLRASLPAAPVVDARSGALPTPLDTMPAGVRVPKALLFDNGGVLTHSEKDPDGVRAFAAELASYLRNAGHEADDAWVYAQLKAGHDRYSTWKDEHDHGVNVPEITATEFWGELVAADWPRPMRAALLAEAPQLLYRYVRSRSRRSPRPGMLEVLEYATTHGIKTALVSNTVCGRVARENLAEWGMEPHLGVSLFSDEMGVRKPGAAIVNAAAMALGVELSDCWFVGDKRGRDIAAARRAGAGAAVLIESRSTAASDGPEPDISVSDAAGLLEALRTVIEAVIV
jgi:HAD superfamily hydrolase (TIGR01549 family)